MGIQKEEMTGLFYPWKMACLWCRSLKETFASVWPADPNWMMGNGTRWVSFPFISFFSINWQYMRCTDLFLCSWRHQAGGEQPREVCGSQGGRLQWAGCGNGDFKGGRSLFRWPPPGSRWDPNQWRQDDRSGSSVLIRGFTWFSPKQIQIWFCVPMKDVWSHICKISKMLSDHVAEFLQWLHSIFWLSAQYLSLKRLEPFYIY